MSLEQEFSEAVNAHFQILTPLLDAELLSIAQRTYSGAVKFFLFEYDSPHFSEDFPVSVWPMNAEGQLAAEGHWLLKGKAVAVPEEIYWADKFHEIEPWITASGLLENWLVERWATVVKKVNTYPAFVGHHDSYFKTDLGTGRQINWDEILKAIES